MPINEEMSPRNSFFSNALGLRRRGTTGIMAPKVARSRIEFIKRRKMTVSDFFRNSLGKILRIS